MQEVEIVTGAEIGRRLGVTREAVRQWRRRDDFPEPLGRAGRAVVWEWQLIESWAAKHRPRPAGNNAGTGHG
jgi:predicted DNA-binding transcriptional regulator AlpA